VTEYGQRSHWRDTAGADAAKARELADRLELRGKAGDEIEARRAYLDLLGVTPGERVLDVGCGSGVVTREIARRVGADGRVVGLDASPGLLAVARELAQAAGLGDRVEFREGSALHLPFADGSFDAVLCVTVLSHVPGGEHAVPELVRVLKPGGRLGIFDFDSDMTVVTHPDRALTRRIVAAASDLLAVDGWLARRLPRLFGQAGLEDVRVRGFFPLETDPQGFYASLAERAADAALEAGAIDQGEHGDWLRRLRAERERGPVVAGRLHMFVWARKPA
jgi:ubiquinone/menaquinone biosynthesis C-methylase UbiE